MRRWESPFNECGHEGSAVRGRISYQCEHGDRPCRVSVGGIRTQTCSVLYKGRVKANPLKLYQTVTFAQSKRR